jgi:PKD repeat protein
VKGYIRPEKGYYMGKYVYWLLLVVVCGCEKGIIDTPDPFVKPGKIEILLDFTYRESSSTSGFVRFTNTSRGFQSYRWDFGYKNAEGVPVTSTEPSPYTFFPKNGEYLVILKGVDVNSQEQTVRQYVLVTNKPG